MSAKLAIMRERLVRLECNGKDDQAQKLRQRIADHQEAVEDGRVPSDRVQRRIDGESKEDSHDYTEHTTKAHCCAKIKCNCKFDPAHVRVYREEFLRLPSTDQHTFVKNRIDERLAKSGTACVFLRCVMRAWTQRVCVCV